MRSSTMALIMSNYNDARYLRTSLAGLCEQTRPADQIIVVDDGSTDDSVPLIESFAARYPNLKLVKNDRNRGIFYSVSRALALVETDYLAMAAADDVVFPDFVEKSMAALERHPQAGLGFSAFAVLDDKTGKVHDRSRDPAHGGAFDLWRYPEYLSPQGFRRQLRGGIVWMSGNSVVLRRAAMGTLAKLHADLRWHSDWFMNTVIALRHGACVVPKVLCAIREREATYSGARVDNAGAQRRVIATVARKLWRPDALDIALACYRYPVLLSPMEKEVLPALARSAAGWPLAVPYARIALWAGIPLRTDGAPEALSIALAKISNQRTLFRPYSLLPPAPARPTVSVLLANYNHAQYLRDSLGAWCAQTRPPDELIVVDDGSTDDSIAVIEEFARRHPFIRLLRNEANAGQLASINRALRGARGDYVNWRPRTIASSRPSWRRRWRRCRATPPRECARQSSPSSARKAVRPAGCATSTRCSISSGCRSIFRPGDTGNGSRTRSSGSRPTPPWCGAMR